MSELFLLLVGKVAEMSTWQLGYYARVLGHTRYGKLCEAELLIRNEYTEYLLTLLQKRG